jgi:hypothetical protein
MITRRCTSTLLATIPLVGALALVERGNPVRAAGPQGSPQQLIVISAEGPSVSPAMRDLPTLTTAVVPSEVHPALRLSGAGNDDPPTEDPVRQTEARQPEVAPTVLLNFEGISFATGGTGAPPDTNGAAGLTQYVQTVNGSVAVFDSSTGAVILPPVHINVLWTGVPDECGADNDGDPIVLYDRMADRWLITQFAVSRRTGPNYFQCIAVSTTGDATGSYYLYDFNFGPDDFVDYGKFGSWPDAYYASFNTFNSTGSFKYGEACAFDRTAMQSGAPALGLCFTDPTQFGFLPADFDGTIPPPGGSPNPFMNLFSNSSVAVWPYHVDFVTPSSSTFGPPSILPVAAFTRPGTVVPQLGTTDKLDSLGDRLMFRNAYRTDGTNETLVVNHSIGNASQVSVRWYQINDPNGSPFVVQQGTYAPDSSFRWMGSIAMDSVGDIAMGYSVSSSAIHPAISFTGRLPTDPLGTMQAETTLFSGGGSQLDTGGRWGDYSALTVDPNDDCTFWYTTEYIPTNGSFNWRTRISSFVFPNCPAPPPSSSASHSTAVR